MTMQAVTRFMTIICEEFFLFKEKINKEDFMNELLPITFIRL